MKKALLLGASVLFVLRLETAYGLDVTLGPGGDHTTIVAAMDAVIAGGGGKITILDNGEYTGHNGIRTPVDITIEGNPLDPPKLRGVDDCENRVECKDAGGMVVACDDPGVVTSDLNVGCPGPETDEDTALFHVKEGADGGMLTLNGVMLDSCNMHGHLCSPLKFGFTQVWTGRVSPVKIYTVNFNDCIFADRDGSGDLAWSDDNGIEIAVWEECDDITLNFDNCIIPWNVHGGPLCSTAFVSLQHGMNPAVNFNQCSIANRRQANLTNGLVAVQAVGTVITVTNSIIWPGNNPVQDPLGAPRLFAKPHPAGAPPFDGNWPHCPEYPEAVSATVSDGGSGYTVGDQLTLVGGTLRPDAGTPPHRWPNPQPALFEVTAEAGGAVTAVSAVLTPYTGGVLSIKLGAYETPPANPAATTGGTGAGATLDVLYSTDPSLDVQLLSGTISHSIIKEGLLSDGVGDPLGSITQGVEVEVVSMDPLFVDVEGGTFGGSPPALDLMDGFELQPGSPAIGHGDLGQDAGYIRPIGACQLPGAAGGGTCAELGRLECEAQGGTYGGNGSVCPGGLQLPGNSNQDTSLDLSDVVTLLGFLFQGRPASLPCSTDAANLAFLDVNTDTAIDLSDGIFLLAFLFQGGPQPDQGPVCITIVDCPPNPACP